MSNYTPTTDSDDQEKIVNNLVGYAALIVDPNIGRFEADFDIKLEFELNKIGDNIAFTSFTNWMSWLILLLTSPFR